MKKNPFNKRIVGFIFFISVSLIIMTGKTQAQESAGTQAYYDLSHESHVFGHTKFFRIYFPQGYESNHDRFPVIYFFHGWGERYFKDDNARLEYELLKTLVDKYRVILVMWDGNITEEEPGPYNIGNHSDVKFRIQMKDYFMELINHVDRTFRTLPDRQHGLSRTPPVISCPPYFQKFAGCSTSVA